MKKRNLLSGFALAVLMTMGIASAAHANTYTSCTKFNNQDPMPPSGDVVVNNTGACSLNAANISTGSFTVNSSGAITASSVQASTSVTLKSTGGAVTATNVTASNGEVYLSAGASTGDVTATTITGTGGTIQVLAPGGTITVNGAVTGTNTTQIFKAKTNVGLKGGVTNNGTGDVRIFASQGGGSTAFTIGSSTSNGATFINNNGVNGGWIYISNGTSTSGINYSGSDKLQVRGSGGPAGIIILDGGSSNKITLSDDMNANGAAGQASGGILLFTSEVISNNATLSANAPGQQVGSIALTTNKITNNSGLVLNINGNGPFANFVDLSITPVGSWSVTATANPATPITFGAFTGSSNPLTITGSGNFAINANGNNNGLKIWGPSLTINTASTKITQQGGGNGISISAWDGGSTTSAMTLSGDIQIKEKTTASGQPQNLIQIDAVSITGLTQNVLLDASGTNDGDGSNITLSPNDGDLTFGGSGTAFTLKANGGPSGGKGGTILAGNGGTLTAQLNGGDSIVASALGGDGDGGFITLNVNSISNGTGAASEINTNSHGSGHAGWITILPSLGSLTLGTSSGNLHLSANGGDGTGDGGMIEIAYLEHIYLNNGDISVAAGTNASSNGKGGIINFHDFGSLETLNAFTINADAHGTGDAQFITILSQNSNLLGLENLTLSASGDTSNGSGNGGTIRVTGLGTIALSNATINAQGGKNGGAGGSILLGVYDGASTPIVIDSTVHLNANAGNAGANSASGGMVQLDQAAGAAGLFYIDVGTAIKVDGGLALGTAGFGGSIQINGITCQQWKVATGTNIPKFWSCSSPTSVTAVPAAIATIPAGLKTSINGLSTYVFYNSGEYNTFFATVGGAFEVPTGILGNTALAPLNLAAVFVSTGSAVDYTPYLPGNMMHEIGHLLDNNIVPTPSASTAFRNAETATVNALTGLWPGVQTPTCVQVYGNVPNLCAGYANINPWDIFSSRYIGGQNQHREMFADAFQNCSGYTLLDANENTAQQSIYMKDVWTYMNTTFWTGGCTRQE